MAEAKKATHAKKHAEKETVKGKTVYTKKNISKKTFTLTKASNKGLEDSKKYKYKVKAIRVRNGITYSGPWSKTKQFKFIQ